MTSTMKTISFPLILLATIAGAVFAGIAIIIVTIIGMLRAIPKVMDDIYNGK